MLRQLMNLSDLIQCSHPDWRIMLDDTFQGALRQIAKNLKNRDLVVGRAKQIAEAILRLDRASVCLEAAMAQTSLPIIRELLERHKATTGEFDFDDQIQGVALALNGKHGDEAYPVTVSSVSFRAD